MLQKIYPFDIIGIKDNEVKQFYSHFPFVDSLLLNALITQNLCDLTVEIGSWTGQSSCILGSEVKAKGGKMFCIDNFQGSPDSPQVKHVEGAKDILTRNLKRLGLNDVITILEGNSNDFVSQFEDESIDFMFIDADHRYSQFRKDIDNWFPKIKVGGIISGHDFDSLGYKEEYTEKDYVDNCHHGVVKAMSEVARSGVKVGHAQPGTIWWINKTAEIAGATLSPQPQPIPDKVGGKEGRDERTKEEGTRPSIKCVGA